MTGNRDVIVYLDIARLERKISIQNFVEGITSRRNYSRLLSGNAELSFELLGLFLGKLGIPLYEFGLYAYNKSFSNYINEIWFHEYVRSEKYDEAFKLYYPLIQNKPYGSMYSKKTIPIAIKLMEFKLNHIHHSEAYHSIVNIVELNHIINSTYLTADDVEAIYLFLRICNDNAKEQISNFYIDLLDNHRNRILSASQEVTIMTIYLSTLIALTTKEKAGKWDRLQIVKVFRNALEYHIKAKTLIYDYWIFQVLYRYIKKNNIRNKWIVFHYIASIASSYENTVTTGTVVEIEESDVQDYLDCIKEDVFTQEPMYERLLKNEIY